MQDTLASSLLVASMAVTALGGYRERVAKGSTDDMKALVKEAAQAFPEMGAGGTGLVEEDLIPFVQAGDAARAEIIEGEISLLSEWETEKAGLVTSLADNMESIVASEALIQEWKIRIGEEKTKIAGLVDANEHLGDQVDTISVNVRDCQPGLAVFKRIHANKEVAFSALRMELMSEVRQSFFATTRETVESKIGSDKKLGVATIHALVAAGVHKHSFHGGEPVKLNFHEVGKMSVPQIVDLISKILGFDRTRLSRRIISSCVARRRSRSNERKRLSMEGGEPSTKKQRM